MRTQPDNPPAREICPSSLLPIERRPEWQDIELTRDYRVSFAVVGGRVLHTRPIGNPGPTGMQRLFDERRAVLREAGLWDRPHCEIKDYSGVSLRHPGNGNVQLTELLAAEYERGLLRGYWGYGGPRVLRWIMAATRSLSDYPNGSVYFVSDYPAALRESLQTLEAPPDRDTPPLSRRTRRDDWSVAVGGYRVEFEVWDGSILYGRPVGRLTRTAAAHLFDLKERILADDESFPDGTFAQLSDLSGLRRVDWNALRYIQQRYLALHEKHPCRGVVVFGTTRTFHAVAHMARAVLPFPYLVRADRSDGLRGARRLHRHAPGPGLLDLLRGKPRYSRQEMGARVSELIEYAATINWHAAGIEDPQVDLRDPLAPIYALLRVLKLDFDTMIEDRDRMQTEVLHAAKISSIGRLAAGMAHELNSPLTAVVGYAEHIHRQSSDPQSADQAGRALKCAMRMRDIIDQLTAYSRTMPVTEPELVTLNASVEETLELIDPLMEEHQVVVQRRLAPTLPPIRCVPAQLQSVLFNVLTNAFDAYAGAEGEGRDSNPVEVVSRLDGDMVELQCRDQGSGMSRNAVAHAFEPFFTTKDIGEGTGLGLYVTHRIVTDSGGTIQLHSTPGQGTTVCIRFPAANAGPDA